MRAMEHEMILSASGWRKVFAVSGDENDRTFEIGPKNKILAMLAADAFASYILDKKTTPSIVLGIDSRPTGLQIADAMIRVFMARRIAVSYVGIIAAPEIMTYAHTLDAFVYISASHNPIGHNGIKFGLNDGGVLNPDESRKLISMFEAKCADVSSAGRVQELSLSCSDADLDWVFAESVAVMREASSIYRSFAKTVISGLNDVTKQNKFFVTVRKVLKNTPIGVVCDMNGSARTLSIDSAFLNEIGVEFHAINNRPGEIKHAIIPEGENLNWCAEEMSRLHAEGKTHFNLGYMPDCDGDRGNFVIWNEKTNKPEVLKAQEVFALSVLSELSYSVYMSENFYEEFGGSRMKEFLKMRSNSELMDKSGVGAGLNLAVVANGPTSMRIDDIASCFNAKVFRAEVGEANVVSLAREKRAEGYTVRILGEGSNGGNITHPSAVRDPLNTLFALLKLIVIRDSNGEKGLFHIWCEASGQMEKYEACKDNFSITDIIETLPKYTSTGISESRAVLHIESKDHGELKARFQKIFEEQWNMQQEKLLSKYGIASYEVIATKKTDEKRGILDFSVSGTGGLKILFYDGDGRPVSYLWMRGSGTEPVFRVLCDVRGDKPEQEEKLLEWETKMLLKADDQL